MIRQLILLLPLVLAGCATGPAPVSPSAPAAQTGSAGRETPAVTTGAETVEDPASSAVSGLIAEARALREAGNIDESLVRLERALRIAPESALVYLELARSHEVAGNDELAKASAERGLLYCEGWTCANLNGLLSREQ